MSTYEDLAAALKRVREATGDPHAWTKGLTPDEVSAVVASTTRPEQLDAILGKIRQQHPDLFNPSGRPPTVGGPPPDRPQGEAAEAIAQAEAALAHQNSASSQLDLQVISAILNAHLKAVDGRGSLAKLQQEIEAAVRTRSDLDTAAGARDFQRFLIGKLRDIRAVVADASLDDTSKSALMAAWTSLYNASKGGPSGPGEGRPPAAAAGGVAPTPARAANPQRSSGWDPYLDPLLADDPALLAGESPAQGAAPTPAAPSMPMTPAMPGIPGTGSSGGGAVPASMPGLSAPSGLPLPGPLAGSGIDPALRGLDDERHLTSEEREPNDHASDDHHEKDDKHKDPGSGKPESAPAGPTTVTLPNGETVTAASPQLAAAIKAAAGGIPIPDAFRQQGITIPAPGTPVAHPIELSRVTPGDIGMFTDRHALALGHTKAILDGQIQHISTVSGPSFLGWEHPPATVTQAPGTTPAPTEPPTPTRPAVASVRWTTY
jgi:hypothetical protein